ncbi:MAG: Flp family type IVb pilin [Vampirovibrionia bacterium]
MKNKGQNLIEFGLIIALIILGGVFALTMLGGNVYNLFANSAEKQENFDPFNVKNNVTTNNNSSSTSNSEDYEIVETKVIGNYSVDMLADGSALLNVSGKNVVISANSLKSIDTVMKTTGAEGELIDIVGYMLETHAEEYPDTDVPMEITFGNGTRYTDAVGDGTYYNSFICDASINTVSVKVGDHLVILSNDQDVVINDGVPNETMEMGVNRIEGTIRPDGVSFDGKITSDNPSLNNQSFSAIVSQTADGFNFVDNDLTYYEEFNADGAGGHLETGGKWELNFITGNGV